MHIIRFDDNYRIKSKLIVVDDLIRRDAAPIKEIDVALVFQTKSFDSILAGRNAVSKFSLILEISPLFLIPTIKSFLHLIICNCAAVKVEWRSESDWFGLLIHFISDRRESNSLQITSFNPDTLIPFKIFLLTAFIY